MLLLLIHQNANLRNLNSTAFGWLDSICTVLIRFKQKHMLPWEIPADYFLWKWSKDVIFFILTLNANISWLHYSWGAQDKAQVTHVSTCAAAGKIRRWPCNWPWLCIITRSNLVILRNIFLWWQGHNISALSYSFTMVIEPKHNASPWWLARPHKCNTLPTHAVDSTLFFFKLSAGTNNISWSEPCWGPCMTQVAMSNEAAWDPGDGIIFFILVQNRRNFGTSELCSRSSTVYKKCSDIEVIWEDGVFDTKVMYRDSTSNLFS